MNLLINKKLIVLENILTRLIARVGKLFALLSFATMLISSFIVLFRYMFNFGSIALQELVIYLHAMTFLFCSAYTLQKEKHIRVDIFYQKFSARTQALVNISGTLLLLWPFLILITVTSWDYIAISWKIKEGSSDAGGLPLVYLLKTSILGMVLLLALQSIAEIIKQLKIITNAPSC